MAQDKEVLIKDIMSIRRRKTIPKQSAIREIDIFEEQVEKSIKRIEQVRYLAKKFNYEELEAIHRVYAAL